MGRLLCPRVSGSLGSVPAMPQQQRPAVRWAYMQQRLQMLQSCGTVLLYVTAYKIHLRKSVLGMLGVTSAVPVKWLASFWEQFYIFHMLALKSGHEAA